MKMTWDKDLRDRAKKEGNGLFAAGCDNKAGKWVLGGMMSHALCEKVVLFAHHLYQTKDPQRAFYNSFPELEPLPIEKAAELLETSFRPFSWFQSVGVAGDHLIVYLMTKNPIDAKLNLYKEKGFHGHCVEVQFMGPVTASPARPARKKSATK